jgi:Gpi18-like mannosyltransferase
VGSLNYIKITVLWAFYLIILQFIGVSASAAIESRLSTFYTKYKKKKFTYGSVFDEKKPQVRWDSFWYLNIAREGYSLKSKEKPQSNTAFFPLYPMLIRALYVQGLDLSFAAMWIARIALLLLLYAFFYYISTYIKTHDPWLGVYALLCFPTSYIFSVAYSESLYALFVCLLLISLYKNNSFFAIISAVFAGMTRPTSLCLFPVVLFFAWKRFRSSNRSLSSFFYSCLPIFSLAFGFLFVFFHHFFVYGNFFQFMDAQKQWGNSLSYDFLLNNVKHGVYVLRETKNNLFFVNRYSLDFFSNMLLLFATYRLWKWKYFPESLFALSCFVVNSFKPGLSSASRFIIVCLPIFFLISHKKTSAFVKNIVLGSGLMLQVYFWIYFVLFLSPNP